MADHGRGGYTNDGCRCEVCTDAHRQYSNTYRAAHLEQMREYYRTYAKKNRVRHGMTPAEREAFFVKHNWQCDCCNAKVKMGKGQHAIDHDHSHCPGKEGCAVCVRGLLCNDCNRAAGFLRDSSERARQLALYLIKVGK
jgi:hypothetical protein